MELQRNTHHVYRLMYHFVWIPKYRHKVFSEPYREVLKGIIEKIGYDYDIDIVELEIPEDHIHMVVRGEPKKSPSDVMQVIKSISAKEFFRRFHRSRGVIFGEGNCGRKVILLRRLVTQMRKRYKNMSKISWWRAIRRKQNQSN